MYNNPIIETQTDNHFVKEEIYYCLVYWSHSSMNTNEQGVKCNSFTPWGQTSHKQWMPQSTIIARLLHPNHVRITGESTGFYVVYVVTNMLKGVM